jgi:hypothetical protein
MHSSTDLLKLRGKAAESLWAKEQDSEHLALIKLEMEADHLASLSRVYS